jgi:hypothetical protein
MSNSNFINNVIKDCFCAGLDSYKRLLLLSNTKYQTMY